MLQTSFWRLRPISDVIHRFDGDFKQTTSQMIRRSSEAPMSSRCQRQGRKVVVKAVKGGRPGRIGFDPPTQWP